MVRIPDLLNILLYPIPSPPLRGEGRLSTPGGETILPNGGTAVIATYLLYDLQLVFFGNGPWYAHCCTYHGFEARAAPLSLNIGRMLLWTKLL